MSVKSLIFNTLEASGIDVYGNSVPTGEKIPSRYITYIKINAAPSLEAADTEIETEHYYQVNVWSKSDPELLVNQIRKALETVGFERTNEFEMPKQDGDSHFNYVLRFVYYEEY